MASNAIVRLAGLGMALGLLASSARAGTVLFDFEDQAFGASAPLSISQNGLTATFASATDPTSFAISGGLYQSLAGNYLAGGANFSSGNTLTITFSQGIRAIAFDFATDTDPSLGLVDSNGGTASAIGAVPSGFYFYPEGTLSHVGAYFTSVTLSSPALTFAIDNVVATVPEPATVALFGLAIVGAGAARRRNNNRNA